MSTSRTRRLAAIMFTDIVGYTAMMRRDEATALQRLDVHRETLERLTAAHGGKVIQYYGDGSLSIYDSAVEAVQCALEMQQAYQQEPRVPLRIGIHIGDIAYGGGNIYGDGVNVASRIETLGIPSAVLFSERVYDDIKNHSAFEVRSMGAFEFKNVGHSMQVYALCNEGLAVPTAEDMKKGKLKAVAEPSPKRKILSWGGPLLLLLVLALLFPKLRSLDRSGFGLHKASGTVDFIIKPYQLLNAGIDTILVAGLVEELRNSLSNIDENFIVKGHETGAYVAKMGVGALSDDLRPDYLIQGSVRRDADALVVTTSITDLNAASEVTLGLGSYQVSGDSILLLAPEIALQAAQKLNLRLTADEEKKIRISTTDSLKARELFTKSEYYFDRLLQLDTAIELLTQAISIDPNYAEAYARRAVYQVAETSWHGNSRVGELRNKIAEDVDKALALKEDLSVAYYARATANMLIDWDLKKAEQNFEKAETLTPPNQYQPVSAEYAWYLGMVRGEMEKGFELMEKVYQSDPMSISKQMNYSWALFMVGRKEEAYELVRRMAQQAPEAPFSYVDFFFFYVDGNYEKALELSRKYDSFFPPERVPYSLYYEGFIYAKTGDRENALRVTKKLDEYKLAGAFAPWDYALPKAVIYAYLGDKAEAYRQLEISFREREKNFICLSYWDRYYFEEISEEPEFKAFYKKLGLEV